MSGRGRGFLLKQALSERTSDNTPCTPSDSGLQRDVRSDSPSKIPVESSTGLAPRAIGRAKLLASLTAPGDKGVHSIRRGRSESDSLSCGNVKQGMARGRGALINLLKMDLKKTDPGFEVKDDTGDTPIFESKDKSVEQITENLNSSSISAEQDIVNYRGTKGTQVNAVVNYIRLKTHPDMGIFEYEVRYEPAIANKIVRYKMLLQHRNIIGEARTFDGQTLYLPIKLPNKITALESNDNQGQTYTINVIFKKQKKFSDRASVHLYNVLFDRIMKQLQFVRFNRKQFDPSRPVKIPQHKLEIWPGYVTAVDDYENGVMLCLDVSFRVLNERTVYDLMNEAYRSSTEDMFRRNFEQVILGSVILTRYNNKTYRVDEVLWDLNPASEFEKSNGEKMSYADYYKRNYDITVRDLKQPLLLHYETRRVTGKEQPEEIKLCFIPELSYLTGITDTMRSDFKVMKDVATCTRITPNQRVNSLRTFIKNVKGCPEASSLLSMWGLTLDDDILKLTARQMEEEKIIFRSKTINAGRGADFNRDLCNNEVIDAIDLYQWLLIYTKRDKNTADTLIDIMSRNSRPMGIQVSKPIILELQNDSVSEYVNGLRTKLNNSLQIVVIICPTSRDDRYAAIKRVCCAELPIPSQVINSKTLKNDTKNRSIVQKILLQMNCKMGGTLWGIKIPLKNVMICGVDTFHEASNKGNSVAAFVASLDQSYTKWYSRAIIQCKKEELLNGLTQSLRYAITQYKAKNHELPSRIIIFRDGVGDGQLGMIRDYEIKQLKTAWEAEMPGYNPKFTFIVVQKRINTRIMLYNGKEFTNPQPGTVVDHTVTRKFMYDFYLVPQSVRQGTVTPTHYIVVEDNSDLTPDIMQRLSYKLCFMYYNWPGTVRVPACCQYAHKLAFLVGQHVKRQTADTLASKLFYL